MKNEALIGAYEAIKHISAPQQGKQEIPIDTMRELVKIQQEIQPVALQKEAIIEEFRIKIKEFNEKETVVKTKIDIGLLENVPQFSSVVFNLNVAGLIK